jgi:hypothetical protein
MRAIPEETTVASEQARKRAREWLEACGRLMGTGPVVILPEVEESLAELLDEWLLDGKDVRRGQPVHDKYG